MRVLAVPSQEKPRVNRDALMADYSRRRIVGMGLLILLTVGLRLPNLDGPLVGQHAWRQTDTASIARNFVREDNNLLHPRVHWRGDTAGEVECEFPLYPWIVAQLESHFGGGSRWSRLPAILSALFAVLGILSLGNRWFGRKAGWTAAVFLSVSPLAVYFGRVPMGDVSMMAAQIWGLVWFDEFLASGRSRYLLAGSLMAALAGLFKLPALHIGLPLLGLLILRQGGRGLRDVRVLVAAALVLGLNAAWYAHAHQWSQASGLSFGIWHFGSDKVGRFDLLITQDFYRRVFLSSLFQRVFTWAGTGAVVLGMALTTRGTGRSVVLYWLASLAVFASVCAAALVPHNYYLMPFVPVGALMMGVAGAAALDSHRRPWLRGLAGVLLLGALGMSISETTKLYSQEDSGSPILLASEYVRDRTLDSQSILVMDRGGPEAFYYADRHGWKVPGPEATVDRVSVALDAGVAGAVIDEREFDPEVASRIRAQLQQRFGPPTRYGSWLAYVDDETGSGEDH
jgi:hypothetical protein